MEQLTTNKEKPSAEQHNSAMRKCLVSCQLSVVSCFRRGFTLVEMVVYIGLFSMLSLVAVTSTITIMKSFYSLRITQDVEQSGTTAFERMALEVRNAYDIDTANSTLNSSPGRLTLKTKDSGGNNTTVEFYVASTTNPSPTWTQVGSSHTYRGIAMSADGVYQTAVGPGPDYIYVSSDRGVTWRQNGTAQAYYGVGMSSDGKYQTVTAAGYTYVSSDYGTNWTQKGTFHNHYGAAVSSDGKYQTVVAGNYISISSNYGATWTDLAIAKQFAGVSMSADGMYQSAVTIGGGSYRSTDYGATWTQTSLSNTDRRAIAMSSNGRY
jgi:type II secretory pathway pseudopilin PulG